MDHPRWERIKVDEDSERSARLEAVAGEEVRALLAGNQPAHPSAHYCETPLDAPEKLVVAVVGPTASGKSDLSLDLAEFMPSLVGACAGEVIGADALQLYRGMDIGTAKTPIAERRGIPHHQIDVLDIHDEASVASYQKYARCDLADIHARGNAAVVAGGSGLYQRALLDIIDFPGTDPEVRQRLEKECEGVLGSRGLHRRLAQYDPLSAERIDPANARRIIRALEVIELTGKPYSSNMPRHEYALPTVMMAIAWEREALDARIALRTQMMFDSGLIEEVRSLLDAGLRETKTASRATGYSQAIAVIDGDMSVEEAIESVALATRQLARKQVKWLRPDPRVHWIPATVAGGVAAEAKRIIESEISHF